MFIKLVVLILVCGSSGVGLLSVRQSRLQAAHEMAESRHRIRLLEEQAGELRAQIAQASTPDRIAELLDDGQGYRHAVQHLAELKVFDQPVERIIEPTIEYDQAIVPLEPVADDDIVWIDEPDDERETWYLNDGSRVILISD